MQPICKPLMLFPFLGEVWGVFLPMVLDRGKDSS